MRPACILHILYDNTTKNTHEALMKARDNTSLKSQLKQLKATAASYLQGEEKSLILAIHYYELAAQLGDVGAMLNAAELHQQNTAKTDNIDAINWYVKASKVEYTWTTRGYIELALKRLSGLALGGDNEAEQQLVHLETVVAQTFAYLLFNLSTHKKELDEVRIYLAIISRNTPIHDKYMTELREILKSHTSTFLTMAKVKAFFTTHKKNLPESIEHLYLDSHYGSLKVGHTAKKTLDKHNTKKPSLPAITSDDPVNLFNQLLKLARANDHNADYCYRLAIMYKDGVAGREPNYNAAAFWFYKAIINPSKESNRVNHFYQLKTNVDYRNKQDTLERALKTLEELKENKCGDAAYYLHAYHRKHSSGSASATKKWKAEFELAVTLESPRALGQLYHDTYSPVKGANAKAALTRLSERGNHDATDQLRERYYSDHVISASNPNNGYIIDNIDFDSVKSLLAVISENDQSHAKFLYKTANDILNDTTTHDKEKIQLLIEAATEAEKYPALYLKDIHAQINVHLELLCKALANIDAFYLDHLANTLLPRTEIEKEKEEEKEKEKEEEISPNVMNEENLEKLKIWLTTTTQSGINEQVAAKILGALNPSFLPLSRKIDNLKIVGNQLTCSEDVSSYNSDILMLLTAIKYGEIPDLQTTLEPKAKTKRHSFSLFQPPVEIESPQPVQASSRMTPRGFDGYENL